VTLIRITLCLPRISPEMADRVEFYRADRELLAQVGTTTTVHSARDIGPAADLVYTWWWARSLPVALAARRYRIPIVVTGATDIGNPVGESLPRVAAKILLGRASAQLASANLAISGAEANRLRSWRYPRLRVVPLAVDVDWLSPPASVERDPGLLVTILHLNRLSVERKGLLRAIDVLARLEPDARLVVVGEDQGAGTLVRSHALARGVGSRVELRGMLSREAKRELLWRAGTYIQLSSYEGFGLAVAEAMAARCPVLVSRAGSLPEITGGAAIGYADTVDEASAALGSALADPERARATADRAFDHCRRELSYEVRRARLADVVGEVVEGSGGLRSHRR
jgi:glycosyltransferase involved in cell wall biosynthesis